MNWSIYINWQEEKIAASLSYAGRPNTWEIYPEPDNRYRVLKEDNTIRALDLNIGGMIEVGKALPGHRCHKVIQSIKHVVGDKGIEYFEVAC